eukprot:scaffold196_cov371-Prasinococcus_capsulatus_cf.AAC.29
MHHPHFVAVLDHLQHLLEELCRLVLRIVHLGHDSVEQLASLTQFEHQVHATRVLKVVVQAHDGRVALQVQHDRHLPAYVFHVHLRLQLLLQQATSKQFVQAQPPRKAACRSLPQRRLTTFAMTLTAILVFWGSSFAVHTYVTPYCPRPSSLPEVYLSPNFCWMPNFDPCLSSTFAVMTAPALSSGQSHNSQRIEQAQVIATATGIPA